MELEPVKPFIYSKMASELNDKAIHLIGFPFDGTTSYRPGSRSGPDGLREASFNLEGYSPYLDLDLEDIEEKLFDLGNLNFMPSRFDLMGEEFQAVTNKMNQNHRLVTLGGEHSISYFPIKKHLELYSDMVLIHLDAHADLRDGYLGNPHSHASIIARINDHFTEKNELIQYGIRSGTKEEFKWMRENKTLATSLEELIQRIDAIANDRPVYLTLDLDFFDPSELPGTGTPEAGGETFHSFVKIIKHLKAKNFIGADIVELAPGLDPSGISSCLASKVTREVLLALR